MSDNVLKYNYGRIKVSSSTDWAEFIRTDHAVQDALVKEMNRAQADIYWDVADQLRNSDIGPRHRPGRAELHEVRRHERNRRRLRSMGRPAGGYRR